MQKSRWRTCRAGLAALAPCRRLLLPLAAATLACGGLRAQPAAAPAAETTGPSAGSIYFAAGATTIDAAAERVIRGHAVRLRALPDLNVTIIAHTDELGSASLELARGQQRLDAVRKQLEEEKIPASRIRTLNHGSEEVAEEPCHDDDCRRRRRRIDFVFHP